MSVLKPYQTGRYGKIHGYYYEKGQMVSHSVDKLRRPLSRGLWQYDLTDPSFTEQTVTLDNGRTIEDLTAH